MLYEKETLNLAELPQGAARSSHPATVRAGLKIAPTGGWDRGNRPGLETEKSGDTSVSLSVQLLSRVRLFATP